MGPCSKASRIAGENDSIGSGDRETPNDNSKTIHDTNTSRPMATLTLNLNSAVGLLAYGMPLNAK